MATVYRAYDKELDREVALKHLEASRTQELIARFFREFDAAAKLQHANIIGLYDIEEIDDGCFFTMELFEGPSLQERLQEKGSLPLAEALTVFRQITNALIALHNENIIHRDLKPANILFSPSGRAVLADFGLARDLDITSITETGVMLGTPSYMCPEQIRTSDVDGRSDIYQLGLIFYEMVAGKIPFARGDMATLFNRILHDKVKPLIDVNKEVPLKLSKLVAKCLAKDPNNRFHSAKELLSALDELDNSDASISLKPQNMACNVSHKKAQKRAIIGLLLLTLFVMVWLAFQSPPAKRLEGRENGTSTPIDLATLLAARGNSGLIELPRNCFCNETIEITDENLTLVGTKGSSIDFKCAPAFVLASGTTLSLHDLTLSAGNGTMISVSKGILLIRDCKLIAKGTAISVSGEESHLEINDSEVTGKGPSVISIRDKAKANLTKLRIKAQLAKHGVNIFNGQHVTLSQCEISLCQTGLVVYGHGNTQCLDSKFFSCKDCGILLRGYSKFFAKMCQISDCSAVGIEVRGGSPKVEKLKVTNSDVCIKLLDQCKANIIRSSFVGGCGGLVYKSAPTFDECMFENNVNCGLTVGKRGQPIIKSSTFRRNGLHGVDISSKGRVSFKGCSFVENKAYGCRTKGRVTVINSFFHKNGLTGLAASTNSVGTITQTTSSHNKDYGFDLGGQSNYTISDCELRCNNKANMRVCPLAIVKCKGTSFIASKSNGVTCLAANANLYEDCRFIGNAVHGLKLTAGSHQVRKTLFRQNSKGLYLNGANALVDACSFIKNTGFHLMVKNGRANLSNCNFIGLPKSRSIVTMAGGTIKQLPK